MERFAPTLEYFANFPVLDKTGLTGRFDFELNCTADDLKIHNLAAINQALSPLGRELVPGRESLEMLVVEKAK